MTDNTASPQSSNQYQYAGFGRRLLAFWIDAIILIPISFTVQKLMGAHTFDMFEAQTLEQLKQMQQSQSSLIGLPAIVSIGLGIAYYLIMWVNFDGATPGKKLMAIKIIKDDGSKITYPVAFIRYIGNILSGTVLLGYLWIIWDKKKQGWHDKMAGTIVVKTDKQPKTFLSIVLSMISIVVIIGFMIAYGFHITRLIIQESNTLANRQGGVITDIVNQGQPLTQLQADQLSVNVFKQLNEQRTAINLVPFKEDQQLCAYTQRRLDYLVALGKQDDGRGFYEDTANPQISQAYFAQFLKLGTILFNLNPSVVSSPE